MNVHGCQGQRNVIRFRERGRSYLCLALKHLQAQARWSISKHALGSWFDEENNALCYFLLTRIDVSKAPHHFCSSYYVHSCSKINQQICVIHAFGLVTFFSNFTARTGNACEQLSTASNNLTDNVLQAINAQPSLVSTKSKAQFKTYDVSCAFELNHTDC